jgi:hypothetical protein
VVGKEADQSEHEDDEPETEINGEFVDNGLTGFLDEIPVNLSLKSPMLLLGY